MAKHPSFHELLALMLSKSLRDGMMVTVRLPRCEMEKTGKTTVRGCIECISYSKDNPAQARIILVDHSREFLLRHIESIG